MAVIVFRCTGCNRLVQLRENQRGVTTVGLCTVSEGCSGHLIQVNRLQDADTPLLAERIPDLAGRRERNALFNHIQGIVSTVWLVVHDLGTNPVVQVAVDRPGQTDRVEIEPKLVEIIDENTTRITFDRGESGLAQFIARSSTGVEEVPTAVAEPTQFQLTNNNILTIATLDLLTSPLTVEIIYINDGIELPQSYQASFPPTTASPWNDADTVVVKGAEYKIRTIDTTTKPVAVTEGASFYFNDVVYPTADMFLPLTLSPFTNSDKVKRRVIFPEGIGNTEALTSFAFVSNELFAVDTIIEDVYPPVFVV